MNKIDNTTKKLLLDPSKRRAWIKYQIHLLGLSMAKVAAAAGVSRQCLYQAFHTSYPRMEKVIADALEMAPSVLFPERYDADGLPIYRMGRPKKTKDKSITKKAKNTTSVHGRNVHNGEAV